MKPIESVYPDAGIHAVTIRVTVPAPRDVVRAVAAVAVPAVGICAMPSCGC
ncbi:hypothetical protein [Corynebacterium efficiens]|uniref:hypothetical protein n=1 Tax=Corynebacterium efficiens TaxID=152794 RepID=UPI0002DE04F0|nr:hypothetical protein [Corynebacterium efficiens]